MVKITVTIEQKAEKTNVLVVCDGLATPVEAAHAKLLMNVFHTLAKAGMQVGSVHSLFANDPNHIMRHE